MSRAASLVASRTSPTPRWRAGLGSTRGRSSAGARRETSPAPTTPGAAGASLRRPSARPRSTGPFAPRRSSASCARPCASARRSPPRSSRRSAGGVPRSSATGDGSRSRSGSCAGRSPAFPKARAKSPGGWQTARARSGEGAVLPARQASTRARPRVGRLWKLWKLGRSQSDRRSGLPLRDVPAQRDLLEPREIVSKTVTRWFCSDSRSGARARRRSERSAGSEQQLEMTLRPHLDLKALFEVTGFYPVDRVRCKAARRGDDDDVEGRVLREGGLRHRLA